MMSDWNQPDLGESSYFNFLMRNRCRRSVAVPFELITGIRPDRVRHVRVAVGGLAKA